MKNLLSNIFIILISFHVFGQDKPNLPEVPWANLVEMHSKPETRNGQWAVDVKIKLVGSYSSKDSVIIAEVIQQLDEITETITIGFAEGERGNLEVFFIDSINSDSPGYVLSYDRIPGGDKDPHTNKYFISDVGRTYARVIVEKNKISPLYYNQFLKNRITKEIGGGYLTDGYFLTPRGTTRNIEALKIAKNRNSIFNKYENIEAHRQELNELDIAIIKATYQPDYKEKLELARVQFKVDPWWLKVNPSIILIFPIGIILLVCTYFAFLIFNKYAGLISKAFWKLNFKVLLGITITTISLVAFNFLSEYWYHLAQGEIIGSLRGFRFIQTFIIGFIASAMWVFPVINLIAYLESIIQKYLANRFVRLFLVFVITFFIPFVSIVVININSLRNNNQFSENDAIENISTGLIIFFILAGFWVLVRFFLDKEKDLVRENEARLSSLRELKTKAELNALHSRINPHFLYNSLNSIAGLAHHDADKTEHMALSLSKLFRYSISKEKTDWTTFKEDLEMVKIYLEVEKVRFDDRLTYSLYIPKELKEHEIPRFIIQPLVENAVKHGISKLVGKGEIKVLVNKKGNDINIVVSDNGEPFPDDLVPGFGIQSIYDKLEILYKNRFEMNFTNSPIKQVSVKLR